MRYRAHFLQHVRFEGLGSIKTWLQNNGYAVTATRFFEAIEFPKITDIDLLIVMGGPMSVNEEQDYPWLAEEKRFIKTAIEADKPVLGICLGAQLIAAAMGSKVFPNSVKEIGWFPIRAAKSGGNAAFKFPEEVIVFHWHGEAFELPTGATQLAESAGCKNQAFQIGTNVIGLQFHLETTPKSARAIIENCSDELVDGKFVQTKTEILSASYERYATINSLMDNILDYLHKKII